MMIIMEYLVALVIWGSTQMETRMNTEMNKSILINFQMTSNICLAMTIMEVIVHRFLEMMYSFWTKVELRKNLIVSTFMRMKKVSLFKEIATLITVKIWQRFTWRTEMKMMLFILKESTRWLNMMRMNRGLTTKTSLRWTSITALKQERISSTLKCAGDSSACKRKERS